MRTTRNSADSALPEQASALPIKSPSMDQIAQNMNDGKKTSRKRKKVVGNSPDVERYGLDSIMQPVTAKERGRWKGWCEVESEPVSFHIP